MKGFFKSIFYFSNFREVTMIGVSVLLIIGATSGSAAGAANKLLASYARPKDIPYPKENTYSTSREGLGKALFFDPRLSGSNWISCATCHNPALSWGDGLPKGIGHGMGTLGRRTPTILNLAWGELMFWDGRAGSLEEQALGPIQAAGEMNLSHEKLLEKLVGIPAYKPLFEKAYPGEGITKETIGKAIATFERGVISGEAPFDRWVKGDGKAIPESAKRGFEIFNGKGKCATCHSGWRFTDDGFHDIGVKGEDIGRGKLLPDIPAVQFAFKTPTLRNVNHRAPYLHDGSEATLADVIEFYNRGGDAKRPDQSGDVVPLNLSATQKADLLAFMNTLTSVDKPVAAPMLPR